MPASSTYGQTFDAQLEELRDAGCIKMYRKNVTGANNDWRELPKMLDHLAPSELWLRVTRIQTPLAECRPSKSHRFGIGS